MSLSAIDRLEIGDLVAKFNHCSDFGDWEGLVACFTDDVVTYMGGAPTYVGAEAQVAHARNSAEWTANQNRHLALNLWVEPTGPDSARAHYYVLNFVAGINPGEPRLIVSARMVDHVVRRSAGWRIERRDFDPDQAFEVPDGNAGASYDTGGA